MPLIEVRAFESRFADEARTKELIAALTDALVSLYGEDVRAETWVIVDGVSPAHWGFGGEVRS